MTKQEKIKMGVGLAASIGAGALANQMLMPSAVDIKGGKIMKILAVLGVIAVAGVVGDAAGKQAGEMVDSFVELPGLIRGLKSK